MTKSRKTPQENKVDPFVKTQFGSKLKESFPFRLSESGVAAVVVVVGDVGKPALGLSTSSTTHPGSSCATLS